MHQAPETSQANYYYYLLKKYVYTKKEYQLQSSVEMRGASRNWNRWDNEFIEKQTDNIIWNWINIYFK